MLPGNLGQAQPGHSVADDFITIDIERCPADAAAFEFRTAHSGANALDNQRAFQVGDGGNDDDDSATKRPFGVDRLALGEKLDA